MKKEEAQFILDLESWPPLEVLEEIIEEEVFQFRDYFLRNPVIPVLYKSRIRKLEKLQNIQNTFLEKTELALNSQPISTPELKELKTILRFLESQLALTRQKISATLTPADVAFLANQMIEIQSHFEESFKNHCHAQNISPAKEKVMAADQIKTGLALNYIESGNHKELKPLLEKELKRIK